MIDLFNHLFAGLAHGLAIPTAWWAFSAWRNTVKLRRLLTPVSNTAAFRGPAPKWAGGQAKGPPAVGMSSDTVTPVQWRH